MKEIAEFLGRPLTDELAEKIAFFSTMDQMKKSYDKHEKDDPEGIKHTRVLGKMKFLHKGMYRWLNDFFLS